jgi:hypothetical protein
MQNVWLVLPSESGNHRWLFSPWHTCKNGRRQGTPNNTYRTRSVSLRPVGAALRLQWGGGFPSLLARRKSKWKLLLTTRTPTTAGLRFQGPCWRKSGNLLHELGIADKITGYSYQRGEDVFLEEDCDLSVFARAMEKAGRSFDLIQVNEPRGESWVRLLWSYECEVQA